MVRAINKKRALVTGGLGYLGAHVVADLLAEGYSVAVLGHAGPHSRDVHDRLMKLTGQPIPWFTGDVRDTVLLSHAFDFFKPDAVLHFAGLKPGVRPSAQPVDYTMSNMGGLLSLLEVMAQFEVRTLLFSSSAAVYSPYLGCPASEDSGLGPITPYGSAKLMCEQVLAQQALSPGWRIANLRCFNPAGAHPSGLLGEPLHTHGGGLFKQLARVLAGEQDSVPVFGDQWPTSDGTQVRDYFHVADLAAGYVKALSYLEGNLGLVTLNLGAGRGYSVREVISAFEAAAGRVIPLTVNDARPGDMHTSIAHVAAAQTLLGWRPERSLSMVCEDTVCYVHHLQKKGAYDAL